MTMYDRVFLDNGLGSKAGIMYRKRRQRLARAVGALVLLRGVDDGPTGGHVWAALDSYIFQDPTLLYYTGLNQAGVAVVLDPETGEETLFLPKKDLVHEFWEGVRLGSGDAASVADVKRVTGFKQVRDLADLDDFLLDKFKQLKRRGRVGVFWHRSKQGRVKKDHNYRFKRECEALLKQTKRKGLSVVNIQDAVWQQRVILDETDVGLLRQANRQTKQAFLALKRALPGLNTETEAAAVLECELKKRSRFGLSFPSIVACGKNATVLHYTSNHDRLQKGALLLLDFGCREYALTADMSRTIPVSGQMNPLQRLLYNMVAKAKDLVEAAAKPGVSLDALNEICWGYINEQIDKKILRKGGEATRSYQDRPHQVSHLIGYAVHDGDPFREYGKRALEVGMCISNEPGVYGYFELEIRGKLYKEHVGIRLEDNLLITSAGCDKL